MARKPRAAVRPPTAPIIVEMQVSVGGQRCRGASTFAVVEEAGVRGDLVEYDSRLRAARSASAGRRWRDQPGAKRPRRVDTQLSGAEPAPSGAGLPAGFAEQPQTGVKSGERILFRLLAREARPRAPRERQAKTSGGVGLQRTRITAENRLARLNAGRADRHRLDAAAEPLDDCAAPTRSTFEIQLRGLRSSARRSVASPPAHAGPGSPQSTAAGYSG